MELAPARHLLPRLLGMWTHLERQEGAIGTRGPWRETQLRPTGGISAERSPAGGELREVRRVRATQRDRRDQKRGAGGGHRGLYQRGQSTLLNKLTGAEIPANNRLFDTLDTTTRTLEISGHLHGAPVRHGWALSASCPTIWCGGLQGHSGGALLADLLLHVIDASNPEWREQAAVVDQLIHELGPTRPPGWRCSTSATCGRERSVPMGRTSSPSPPAPARGVPALLEAIGQRWDSG